MMLPLFGILQKKTDLCRRLSYREYAEKSVCDKAGCSVTVTMPARTSVLKIHSKSLRLLHRDSLTFPTPEWAFLNYVPICLVDDPTDYLWTKYEIFSTCVQTQTTISAVKRSCIVIDSDDILFCIKRKSFLLQKFFRNALPYVWHSCIGDKIRNHFRLLLVMNDDQRVYQ